MKKIYTYLVGLCLMATGCNEEGFLSKVNPNAITSETFWQSPQDYQKALTTVYGALQFSSISGSSYVQYEEILGDIGGTESWYRPFAFRNLTFNDGTYHVTDKWNELYIGIFRANQVIENLTTTSVAFPAGVKESIEGQARVLRAYYYFQLAHTYGKAVIHTSVPANSAEFKKPLSTKEEITQQIIIPDLEIARKSLPLTWDSSNKGRVTKGTAESLLGKVYVFGKEWGKAAELFKSVIDSKVYKLVLDPMDNFTDKNEFNSESIFEVAYNNVLNPGAPGAAVDDSPSETGSEATDLANSLGQLNFGAFNSLLPSYYLHELFVRDSIDTSNPMNIGNTQSKRLSSSIVPRNGEGLYYQLPIGTKGGWAFGQSAYIKKFTNWYHAKNEDGQGRSGINFRHIRLADVYLMYAEAILNLRGEAAVTEAIENIDLIRARAGVVTLAKYMSTNGGRIPQLHISREIHGPTKYVAPTASNVLTHIMRVERPLELCFEGHRWKDLVRWGIVREVFDALKADEDWRIKNTSLAGTGKAPLFIVERIRPDFLLASRNYNPTAHNYFPIPTLEVQVNDKLNP